MSRLILKRANLVDGEHPARPNSTVVVEGDRIAAVSNGAGARAAAGDRVIDLAGKTLMPGMVLCHFHAAFSNENSGLPLGLNHPPTYVALQAAKNVKTALMCGFTSIVSGGGPHDIDATLKQGVNDGLIPGPRILAGSRELVTTGFYVERGPWWLELGIEGSVKACDGAEEFRKAVRSEIKRGADVIKLYPAGNGPMIGLTDDELRAAIDSAHERGKKVRGHIVNKQALLQCIRAGIDIIDHGDGLDAECIDAILKAGTHVVPTLYFVAKNVEAMEKRGGGMGYFDLKTEQHDYEYMCSMLPEAHAAGVKLTTGDDYGTIHIYHGDYAKEMEFYVKRVGLSPLDVIQWATKNGAGLMGMGDKLGTIAAGKLADLLVVDGDPTVDITVLQDQGRLLGIMKGGVFAKDELPKPA